MRRRRPAYAVVAEQPIASLNTTPLIDVMLVLLIMFIVTIPLMTHSVKIDLPQAPPDLVPEEPQTHRLDMDEVGRLSWDGALIDERALASRLADFQASDPEGNLLFRAAAETRYEDFDRVLASIKRAGVKRLSFVGNENFQRELKR